jgi:uroporphyrinogen-III synthase
MSDRPLENITVAITEHRFMQEFAILFEKAGATVYACPLLEEAPVADRQQLQDIVRRTAVREIDVIVFLTGVGARLLVAEAEWLGLKGAFLAALEAITVVARGSKPGTALRQFGVRVDITPDRPTTEGVIETLGSHDLKGKRVAVQLYGTPNPRLVAALEAQGAAVFPVQVYNYAAASDRESVHRLVFKAVERTVDVVTFTSAPQVRMLFDAAAELGLSGALRTSLNTGIAAASVGEITTSELESFGVLPRIVPAQPKMGAMARAIVDYFRQRATSMGEGNREKPRPS